MDAITTQNNISKLPEKGPKFEDIVGLRDILATLWRRKIMIFMIIAVFVSMGFTLISRLPYIYTGASSVIIEPQTTSIVDFEKLVSGLTPDSEIVLSEVEIIQSRDILVAVIEKLNLIDDAYFNPMKLTHDENAIRHIITTLEKNLSVKPVGRSLVIKISYTHPDPEIAALIANTFADTYIEKQLEMKFSFSKKASDWLDRRLKQLAIKVRETAKAVEDYRAEHNLIDGYKAEITAQQISEINSQLVIAQSNYTQAHANLNQVQKVLNDPSRLDTMPEIANSRFIQNLKAEENKVMRDYSELVTRYGEKHPRIRNIKAELKQIHEKIKEEVSKVAETLEATMNVAQARVDNIQASLRELETTKTQENLAAIRLKELEREAETNRMIYEMFLRRFKETDQREEIEQPDARVISYSDVPAYPSSPNRPAILLLSIVGGFFFSVMTIFFLEQLDNGYRTPKHLEAIYGLPTLTMIPTLERMDRVKIGRYLIDKPYSSIAETVRSLRVSLMMKHSQNKQTRGSVFSITSSVPGEGKTTVSTWLSRSMAMSGYKTLLIDCDLRRPSVHKFFGDDNSVSLIDVLRGKANPQDLIKVDEETGLHRIYGKVIKDEDADILSTNNMKLLIDSFKESYDVIILDSPPCLAVADSRILSHLADETLYLVQWNKTPRDTVHSGVQQTERDGASITGFVITQVDLKRHAQYNYGDISTYHTVYHDYFKEA